MEKKLTVLKKSFSFNDWKANKAQQFKSKIGNEIHQNSLRESLLVSENLNNEGNTYYFLTLDKDFADKLRINYFMDEYSMDEFNEDLNRIEIGFEEGNSELIK